MVGGGKRFDQIAQHRQAARFRPILPFPTVLSGPQPADLLAWRLRCALAIARSETRRADPPIYGIAAASRPIVVIGAAYGELAGLVREHGCGAVVEPGNAAALTTVLRRLSIDPEMAAAMGHRA
jgi:colanic acid biosynthesis glycosyl transferase WcaI